MRLYFLRHGPALSRSEWNKPDPQRPLSPHGAAVTHRVAERLATLDLGIDVILTSPYERACRTAWIVHETLDALPAVVEEPLLEPGHFTLETLRRSLEPYANSPAVMVIGHEPSMSEVLADLVGGGRFVLRKAGLARVDVDSAASLRGELRWFLPPKLL